MALISKITSAVAFYPIRTRKKPILTKELKPKPGIVALKLPQDTAPLEVGKTYRWTVTVVCNPSKPSRNLFAQAWIERVPLPTEVQPSNTTKDTSTSYCSLSYAKAGIWYDALACNYEKLVQNRNTSDNSWQQFQTLIEEIDLAYLTQQFPRLSLYQ
ncbi:MAG: DUF928 domain-containing protein [Hydrococcus sp. SU_1_0]|nr:DUF928 domain-containing protein [Hydrococcus sp. SU_1_0]